MSLRVWLIAVCCFFLWPVSLVCSQRMSAGVGGWNELRKERLEKKALWSTGGSSQRRKRDDSRFLAAELGIRLRRLAVRRSRTGVGLPFSLLGALWGEALGLSEGCLLDLRYSEIERYRHTVRIGKERLSPDTVWSQGLFTTMTRRFNPYRAHAVPDSEANREAGRQGLRSVSHSGCLRWLLFRDRRPYGLHCHSTKALWLLAVNLFLFTYKGVVTL